MDPRTPSREPLPMSEPLCAGLLAIAGLLVLAPTAKVSPDSLELLATARCWAAVGPCDGPSLWPPLWPALLVPFAAIRLQTAAWVLNLVVAGLVAIPLSATVGRLAGRWAAWAAVAVYTLHPAVRENAVVLDARPLMWLATAAVVASASAMARDRRLFRVAVATAALAPLARPEGLLLPVVLGAAALLVGLGPGRALAAFLLGVGPFYTWTLVVGDGRVPYEALGLPWNAVWDNADFLALIGPARAGTPFREYLLRAVLESVEGPVMDPAALLRVAPRSLLAMGDALVGMNGVLGLAGAAAGAWVLWRRGWPARIALVLGLLLVAGLGALPMTCGQDNEIANIVFLVPISLALAGLAVAAVPLRRRKGALVLGGALLLVEVHLAPWRASAPTFVEGSTAALRMSHWLREHPPASGRVACTYAGRGVVRGADLVPVALPSGWEPWHPEPGIGVLLAPDLMLDGGRGLHLLEDPAWVPQAWVGSEALDEPRTWYLYLAATP